MPASSANTPFFIALQVVPAIAWGGTGVGKSSSIEALATALQRTFVPLLGSTHLPEDFSGYPTPDRWNGVVRMMPTTWVRRTMDGRALVFIDEVTNVPAATQAGLLSVITERRVGDHVMPASTIICAAANPPELCPNAIPLAPAMRSRFFHHQWQVDYAHWFAGLRQGCAWDAPTFPVVPERWQELLPKYGGLVEAFLRSAPDCREKLPDDDETLAFPNPRTWTYLVKCFAAAEACGFGPKDVVYRPLAIGCVGEAAGSEFMRYWHQIDLVNPEAILSGRTTYAYEKAPDRNICLVTGLVKCLRENTSEERWLRAAAVFIEIGDHEIESFLMQFKPFWNPVSKGGVRPDGWTPPQDVCAKLMSLVQR